MSPEFLFHLWCTVVASKAVYIVETPIGCIASIICIVQLSVLLAEAILSVMSIQADVFRPDMVTLRLLDMLDLSCRSARVSSSRALTLLSLLRLGVRVAWQDCMIPRLDISVICDGGVGWIVKELAGGPRGCGWRCK